MQSNATQDTFDVEGMFKAWRDVSLNNWAVMSQQMVESAPFTQVMQATTDVVLASQKQLRQNVETFLTSLDLPTKGDLARLSKQVQAAELRALAAEERIEALQHEVAELKAALQSAPAPAAAQGARTPAARKPRPSRVRSATSRAVDPARTPQAAAAASLAQATEPTPTSAS